MNCGPRELIKQYVHRFIYFQKAYDVEFDVVLIRKERFGLNRWIKLSLCFKWRFYLSDISGTGSLFSGARSTRSIETDKYREKI